MIYINEKGRKLVESLEIGKENEEITNPYSKRSCVLCPVAVALYDYIKGCEALGNTGEDFELALMIFRFNWSDEYYILLD